MFVSFISLIKYFLIIKQIQLMNNIQMNTLNFQIHTLNVKNSYTKIVIKVSLTR